jgi:hypothetical protein
LPLAVGFGETADFSIRRGGTGKRDWQLSHLDAFSAFAKPHSGQFSFIDRRSRFL